MDPAGTSPVRRVQPALAYAVRHLAEPLPLARLARAAGISSFHFQRLFAATAHETPRQFVERLRLDRAAALLVTTRQSVLDIALQCGFESHEVFARAFRRRFGTAPAGYRSAFEMSPTAAAEHARRLTAAGPCIGLYHVQYQPSRRPSMTYTVEQRTLSPQPVILARRRISRPDIAATIGAALSDVFLFAQKQGLPLTGFPLTRYSEVGPGLITIEPGMRVDPSGPGKSIDPSWTEGGNAEGTDVRRDLLPAGPAAVTIHQGPYENLPNAYAALEQWMAAHGLKPASAPWEAYLNDPGEHPDPQDWKTEVVWPIQPIGA